jgi:hypothetical protein
MKLPPPTHSFIIMAITTQATNNVAEIAEVQNSYTQTSHAEIKGVREQGAEENIWT